ncbi:transposase [Rhodococcus sp. NPDC059968]|uniref:transposase n=1 Tax=Rhodococcus sp. NPDC059968 TaxID=3347017 RepID=UPI00366DEFCA
MAAYTSPVRGPRPCREKGRSAESSHQFAQNRIWLAIVQLASELIAWTQMLALPERRARRWELKRLRLRLLPIARRIARRTHLRLSAHAPFTDLLTTALAASPHCRRPAQQNRCQTDPNGPSPPDRGPGLHRRLGRTATLRTRYDDRGTPVRNLIGPTHQLTKDRGWNRRGPLLPYSAVHP